MGRQNRYQPRVRCLLVLRRPGCPWRLLFSRQEAGSEGSRAVLVASHAPRGTSPHAGSFRGFNRRLADFALPFLGLLARRVVARLLDADLWLRAHRGGVLHAQGYETARLAIYSRRVHRHGNSLSRLDEHPGNQWPLPDGRDFWRIAPGLWRLSLFHRTAQE